MQKIPSREHVKALREKYPVGTRLELVSMDDTQAPAPGTKGIIKGIDDMGDILMSWDNGSSLKLINGVDEWRRVPDEKLDVVRKQILAIRDTGLTNMFDVNRVQRLAYERRYYELVNYIEENRGKYANFILTGEFE